jgi:PAS domain S-box-containing protein
MRWVNEPIFDDRGQVRFFQGMGTDVTEKVAQENDLMAREALFRRITETMADVVAMHTLEGIYTYLSPSVETVLGYQPDELVGQNPYHYFHPEDQERIHHESHDPSIEQQETQKISYRYLHKAGHYIWIETQTMPVTDGAGNVIAIQTVSRDVSALKYSEDAYETLVNNALQGFVLLQDDRIVFANPRAEEVLGYPLEVLQNLTPEVQNQIIHPDDLPGVLEHLDNIASGREQTARYTTRIIQPSGRILWLEFSTTASSYRGKPALQTAFIDISDKVNTEHALAKSETRYREIVEVNVGSVYSYFCYPPEGSVADPLISQADWHWVRDWEPESTTYALTGYTLAEMDVLGGYPALIVPEDQAAFEGSRHQLQAGDVRTTNYRLITKGSNVIWMEDFIKVIADSYQRRACLRVYGSNRNISERKQAELVLQAALTEKDIMLKEIHHRVKNNMQVISSLLALQSHTVDDIRARQAFAESRQRILAMAEVHKKIYESPDLAGIDFLNYLGYLVRTFGASYRAVAVQVQLEGDPINLGVEQAVPLGLIANELLSNVYKHAFPAGRGRVSEPLVRVNLQLEPYPDGHQVVLTIADNGVGIPEDVQAQSDSLGMTIIYSLIDQLEARVQFTAGITETGIETSTEVDTDTEADTGIAVKITCNWIKPTSKTDTDQFFESHASRPHN